MNPDLRKRLLKEKAAFKAPRDIGEPASWDKYFDKKQITPSGFCVRPLLPNQLAIDVVLLGIYSG
jgi:hypothetical protein